MNRSTSQGLVVSLMLVCVSWVSYGCSCNDGSSTVSLDGDIRVLDANTDADALGEEPDPTTDPTQDCAWESWSEGLSSGSVTDVNFNPFRSEIFAIAGSRFYRSTGVQDWTLRSTVNFSLKDLAFSEDEDGILYAASSQGIVRSDNRGRTWQVYSLGGVDLDLLLIHPADSRRFYALARGVGIFRSNDRGMSWTLVSQSLPVSEYTAIAGDPEDPNTVYVSLIELNAQLGRTTNGRVAKTADGGATWSTALNPGSHAYFVSLCATNHETIWVGHRSGLSRYTATSGWENFDVATDATEVYATGESCEKIYAVFFNQGVWRSEDSGLNWTGPLDNGLTLASIKSPRHLAIDPDNAAHVLAATHGGLFETSDAGEQWASNQGVGYPIVRNSYVDHNTGQARVSIATFGSGLWQRVPGSDWLRIPVTDLPEDFILAAAYSPHDSASMMIGAWPKIYKGESGEFEHVASANVFQFAYHPTDDSIVMAATQDGVFRSADAGSSWAFAHEGIDAWLTEHGTRRDMRSIIIDSSDPNRMIVGSNGRGMFRSTDAGLSWSQLPTYATSSVSCLLEHEGVFYACVGESGLARSSDAGDTWESYGQGLATYGAGSLFAHADNLLAGTSEGLFVRSGSAFMPWDELNCIPGEAARFPLVAEFGNQVWVIVASDGDGLYRIPLDMDAAP